MNASKANSPRFWTRWRANGAVSGMPSATATAPATPKDAPARAAKRVKAATPPATPPVFGTRDFGKDASPRWGIFNKTTDKVVGKVTSRAKAQKQAKALTAAAA